jgi:hypothetical protein
MRPGFTRGTRRRGGGSFAASFGRKPYGAATAAHSTPVTGRLRSPPYPVAAPASTTARAVTLTPSAPIAVKRSLRPDRNAAHCPGRPLQPQRCFASRCAGRACGAPLTLETSADPAGLTARARPEARPETRAANLPTPHLSGGTKP